MSLPPLIRASLRPPPLACMNLSGTSGLSVNQEAARLASELQLRLPNLPSHRLIKAIQNLSDANVTPQVALSLAKSVVSRFEADLHANWDAKKQLRLALALSKFPAALTDRFWTLWAREISRSLNFLTPAELVNAASLTAQSLLPPGEKQILDLEISKQFLRDDFMSSSLTPDQIVSLVDSFLFFGV